MNLKSSVPIIGFLIIVLTGCTSQKKLAYLNNLNETTGEEKFTLEVPDYKIQNRDVLFLTLKAMNPDGEIADFLGGSGTSSGVSYMQGESGGYLYGYDVKPDGTIILPVVGIVRVEGKTLLETRNLLQEEYSKHYKNAILECKLLSFKFTVIGEVKSPGTFINFNNYLTILEAIGRAGGISDLGNRNRVLVIRPIDKGTKTFRLNLQDKTILSSEAYFLLPNDVVIVEPLKQKIFNMNMPTISFVLSTFTSTVTMTLLLINYFGK